MYVMQKKISNSATSVKVGSVTVKIYKVKNRDGNLYTLSYRVGRVRKLRQFSELSKAKAEARIVAEQLSDGRGIALELTGADRDQYLYSIQKLKKYGISLVTCVDEYTTALDYEVPVVEAAKYYSKVHNTDLPDKTVQEVYTDMLAAKKKDGASDYYLADLKKRLKRFCDDFKTNIAEVTTTQIDEWLRALDLSPRSRNNFRNCIVSLFSYAKAAGHLPIDRETVAEHTAVAKDKGKSISFFTPEEFSKILTESRTNDRSVLPLLVLGGFCGLRTEEIFRLKWEHIKWEQSHIIISEEVSKGGEARRRRIASLTPTAAAWLAGFGNLKGPIIQGVRTDTRIRAICKTVNVPWKVNGLRHSYITYRQATVQDPVKVAFECGNSPDIIRSNYDAVATEQEGKAWFSIMPEVPKNVVQMKGAA